MNPKTSDSLCMTANIKQLVDDVVEQQIQPILRQHQGSITVKSIDDGIVKVAFHGACKTCPSAQITVEEVVKKILVDELGDAIKDVHIVNEIDEELLQFAKNILKH